MLDIKLGEAIKEIKKQGAKTVLVQLPEGLKQHTTKIIEGLSTTGTQVFASMDPVFGSCDLALDKMRLLQADLLIHLGHAPIHRPKNVVHIPVFDKISDKTFNSLVKQLEQELRKKKFKTIGLCTHSQFIYLLEKTKKALEQKGFEVKIGKGTPRIAFEGQVLGCNYTTITSIEKKIDATVYIGEGYFHPLGIVFSTKKTVLFADTSREKVFDISKESEKYQRKRFAAIALAMEAKKFGILVSTKSGQRYKEVALHCKKIIEEKGKKAFLFAMDLVREDYMAGVDVDCFVNTACTRIVGDDAEHWKKPIINPLELEIVLGNKKWEEFTFDALE